MSGYSNGHIHSKRFFGSWFAFADVLQQYIGIHAAGANNPRPPALLTALAKRQPLAHTMPACTMGILMLKSL